MIKKDLNHIFYKFTYPVTNNFDNTQFQTGLAEVSNFRLNHDDSNNLECTGISYLSNFSSTSYTTFTDKVKESLFFGRFVKGNYGDQIYLYSKNGNFADISEDTEFIGRESDKTDDEMVIRDFYYIFKLTYDTHNKAINGIVSKPTLKECLSKSELEFVIKKILETNFNELDIAGGIQTFGLEEVLGQQQLSELSGAGLTISYVETKKVGDFMDQLGQNIDGYDESDTVDVNVSLNKTNASKIKALIQKFRPTAPSLDLPIKKLVIKNDLGKVINMEEFCFNYRMEGVEFIDGTIIGDVKISYLKKISKFLVEKIFPNT
ncbi:MAG: hypothetical protein WC774_03270 [Candidatus Gracilibacteria bacterium]